MVNDIDDRGVLSGNWSGKYEVKFLGQKSNLLYQNEGWNGSN